MLTLNANKAISESRMDAHLLCFQGDELLDVENEVYEEEGQIGAVEKKRGTLNDLRRIVDTLLKDCVDQDLMAAKKELQAARNIIESSHCQLEKLEAEIISAKLTGGEDSQERDDRLFELFLSVVAIPTLNFEKLDDLIEDVRGVRPVGVLGETKRRERGENHW